MTRAMRSEWVKLRRPTMLVGVLLTFALLGALVTLLTFASLIEDSVGPGASGGLLAAPVGWMLGLTEVSVLLGVAALVVCASSFAGEYTHGTLRNLLLRQHDRRALLAGKFAALALLLAAGALAAVLAAVAVAFAFSVATGLPSSDWLSGPGLRALGQTTAGLMVALVGFGAVGAVLGVLVRSTALAVGLGVGYVLVVETLLRAALPELVGWLPGQLLSGLVSAGSEAISAPAEVVSMPVAAVRLGVYFAAAIGVTFVLFDRRDVTS